MRFTYLIILPIIFFISCSEEIKSASKNNQKEVIKEREEPTEPCDKVCWNNLPVITQGYHEKRHENVVVETYVKNSNFDTLIKRYEIKNDREIYDEKRLQRSFSLPKDICSDVDMKIIINVKDEYRITNVKTGWIPRVGEEFLGYFCEIMNFSLNGKKESGNIRLRNPLFKYP